MSLCSRPATVRTSLRTQPSTDSERFILLAQKYFEVPPRSSLYGLWFRPNLTVKGCSARFSIGGSIILSLQKLIFPRTVSTGDDCLHWQCKTCGGYFHKQDAKQCWHCYASKRTSKHVVMKSHVRIKGLGGRNAGGQGFHPSINDGMSHEPCLLVWEVCWPCLQPITCDTCRVGCVRLQERCLIGAPTGGGTAAGGSPALHSVLSCRRASATSQVGLGGGYPTQNHPLGISRLSFVYAAWKRCLFARSICFLPSATRALDSLRRCHWQRQQSRLVL